MNRIAKLASYAAERYPQVFKNFAPADIELLNAIHL